MPLHVYKEIAWSLAEPQGYVKETPRHNSINNSGYSTDQSIDLKRK